MFVRDGTFRHIPSLSTLRSNRMHVISGRPIARRLPEGEVRPGRTPILEVTIREHRCLGCALALTQPAEDPHSPPPETSPPHPPSPPDDRTSTTPAPRGAPPAERQPPPPARARAQRRGSRPWAARRSARNIWRRSCRSSIA